MVLNQVERGVVEVREGAVLMGLSERQTRRLLAAYRKEGARALAHGNRGRVPHNTIDSGMKRRVEVLGSSKYAGCNMQHFTELLGEREDIMLSRSSVRRIMMGVGLIGPRKRRAPRHRSRRERYPQEGMLLQTDGSGHDWLEGRGPRLTLVAAIDDATGKVPHGVFREQEDSQGYFLLFREIVALCGIPMAVYRDCHSIFEAASGTMESIEEQLEGRKQPTQFGRLMEELGITSIPSYSPQGRGRIERLWGTFQDRLRSELRLAGARTIADANSVVVDFLPRYNRRFAVDPAEPGTAYRQPGTDFSADTTFCFKYERTVGTDNVVRFGGSRIQIMPSERLSYARTRVEVHERLDGSLAVYHNGQCLATKVAPPEAPVLRARKFHRVMPQPPSGGTGVTVPVTLAPKVLPPPQRKPAPDHPWRGKFRVHIDRG
jgi:transposase